MSESLFFDVRLRFPCRCGWERVQSAECSVRVHYVLFSGNLAVSKTLSKSSGRVSSGKRR